MWKMAIGIVLAFYAASDDERILSIFGWAPQLETNEDREETVIKTESLKVYTIQYTPRRSEGKSVKSRQAPRRFQPYTLPPDVIIQRPWEKFLPPRCSIRVQKPDPSMDYSINLNPPPPNYQGSIRLNPGHSSKNQTQ